MLAKFLLTGLCLSMIAVAIRFDPSRNRSVLGSASHEGPHLRLLTWNIGYAEMEDDSRAHTKDLRAVADTILSQDPDVVGLQELTGQDQLTTLLGYLHKRYQGGDRAGRQQRSRRCCAGKRWWCALRTFRG